MPDLLSPAPGRGSVLVAGSANVDFVARAPTIPRSGETVLGGDLGIHPGGKGANQAVACARAGGVATTLVAALGDDLLAPLIVASLAEAGVGLVRIPSGKATGSALITVSDDAANAITVSPGANTDLGAGDLPPLDSVGWLVLQLETPLATVTAFAQAARTRSVRVLLNAAPAQMLPRALLDAVDVLVVNEDELAAISPAGGTIAQQLAATGVARTIATLGERGCCALVAGEYLLQPVFPVEAVDTTAAGDTFCGTLAAGLASGLAFAAALRRASAAAALATTRPGAQASIPTAANVDALLAEHTDREADALRDYCGLARPEPMPDPDRSNTRAPRRPSVQA